MGIHMNAQETGESEYVKAIQEITTLGIQKLLNPLYHYHWIFYLTSYGARNRKALKIAHDFTDKVIHERKELRKKLSEENNKKRRKAFLDLILDATEKNKSFTDKDIREEVDNFMFAGHDTTSITAVYAFYLLGLNPEVQQKLYEEQVAIFGDSKERPTHKILGEMKYMDVVIKECIRLLPTVPNVSRKLTADMEIGGYKIPAGCNVTVGIYAVTRDERYFPDPEKFDPDRFLPENKKKLHPYAFLPFSAGPRNCIGQKFAQLEEKVFLSMMIRNFKITSVDPFETFKFVPEIVARPVHGVNLILEKRLL